MYARVHFPESKKEVIDEMVQRIRDEFRVMLEEVTWICLYFFYIFFFLKIGHLDGREHEGKSSGEG